MLMKLCSSGFSGFGAVGSRGDRDIDGGNDDLSRSSAFEEDSPSIAGKCGRYAAPALLVRPCPLDYVGTIIRNSLQEPTFHENQQ
ncbi:MAG: hypothetical protein ACTHNN_03310 [Xanthobacteraceae bacterium]